jgi:hypothetical protein
LGGFLNIGLNTLPIVAYILKQWKDFTWKTGAISGLINDIDGFGAFFPSDTEGSNNLIGVMPAAQLASSEAQLKICQNDQLKKLSGITVESNPLVVIAKLR